MVEHANEPPSFRQTVLMCADQLVSEEKVTLGYLNCCAKIVSLPNRDESKEVGVGSVENSR